MKKYGLCKKEKLCSVVAIEQLFGRNGAHFSSLAFPLRIVARQNERRSSDAPVAFLISVPKKRLHHAVDRVTMRRRVREAYRLMRHRFPVDASLRLDVAFIYVANGLRDYAAVERAMCRLLGALANKFNTSSCHECAE